jgi:hypothetical protein
MSGNQPYISDATAKDKHDALVHDTLLSRGANNDAQERQGRFGAYNNTVTVVGRDPPRYPQGQGPWASDGPRVPEEPPLGVAIDDQEPTGEAFEVARSLAAQQGEAAVPNTSEAPYDDVSLSAVSSPPQPPPDNYELVKPTLRKLVRRRSL